MGGTTGTGTFNIDPTEDKLVETGGETIVLGATVAGFNVTPATFTITDDDDAPDRVTLTFGDVGESAGATTSTVTAKLANSDSAKDQDVVLTHDVTVTLTKGSGTATSGTDYAALGSLPTVTISAGSNSGTASLSITPTSDTLDEGTGETIAFTATAATDAEGITLTVPDATLTITDDDTASTVINLSAVPARIDEDAAGDADGDVAVTVTATLEGSVTRTADTTVTLGSTLGGTATSGTDYAAKGIPASVKIPVGSLSGSVTGLEINPTDNETTDGHKTITVTGSLTDFTVNEATITLADDDLIDYDADNDRLIDVDSAAKLNAMRWDINGNFQADNAARQQDFAAAFPFAAPNICDNPDTNPVVERCRGYELTADINLGVSPYNTGAGWTPIHSWTSIFNGNGYRIAGLRVDRGSTDRVGLFSQISPGSAVRNLALIDVSVRGRSEVGGLVGRIQQATMHAGVRERQRDRRGQRRRRAGRPHPAIHDPAERVRRHSAERPAVRSGHRRPRRRQRQQRHRDRLVRHRRGVGVVGRYTHRRADRRQRRQPAAQLCQPAGSTQQNGDLIGGLVGRNSGGAAAASYWDTEATRQSATARRARG